VVKLRVYNRTNAANFLTDIMCILNIQINTTLQISVRVGMFLETKINPFVPSIKSCTPYPYPSLPSLHKQFCCHVTGFAVKQKHEATLHRVPTILFIEYGNVLKHTRAQHTKPYASTHSVAFLFRYIYKKQYHYGK
jgi:hypothetical protein